MQREKYAFEGLVEIEGRVRRLAEDIVYLAVNDRTDRRSEEQLGRFDFEIGDAMPYLDQVDGDEEAVEPEPPEGEEEEDAPSMFGGEEEEPEPAPTRTALAPSQIGPAEIAEAACRWLRDIAIRNTVGEPYRRFRVKAYGAKGVRVIDTGSFVCKNEDHDLELPMVATGGGVPDPIADLRIPTPTFEEASTVGAARGIKALGDYYAQFGQIVLGSMGQLQGINNAMLGRLHKQLGESRDQVDQLVAAILEFRVAELKLADERRADDKSQDTRADLARHALQQLGDAAKAFLAARGVSPEMADVLGAIGQSPCCVACPAA